MAEYNERVFLVLIGPDANNLLTFVIVFSFCNTSALAHAYS
jgi:hypothetical protein